MENGKHPLSTVCCLFGSLYVLPLNFPFFCCSTVVKASKKKQAKKPPKKETVTTKMPALDGSNRKDCIHSDDAIELVEGGVVSVVKPARAPPTDTKASLEANKEQ